VVHIRDFLAELKGTTPAEVERATDEAARKLFGLGGLS
jgi:hypothetical protein